MAKLGVFYSIGFFLIMTAFLAFILVIVKESNLSSERFSEDVGINKIYNLDQSIQKGFKDIFSISGITVRKIGDNITFIEDLPNSKNASFNGNLSKFKNFIESNYTINFNILDINNNLSLFVRPHGIVFTHPNYGGNILKIIYDQNNFKGFSITLFTTKELDATSCSGVGSSSNPYLNTEAFGATVNCNANSIQTFNLYDDTDALLATVDLDSDSNILTVTANDLITVNAKIETLDLSDDVITVTTEGNVLNFNFEDFNFVKNGTIRVL